MNGIGLAATIAGLKKLLYGLQKILKPGGHILFDSSNVEYLYKQQPIPQHYYGEIEYQYVYRGKRSGWFTWLYIDQLSMRQTAAECGFFLQVLLDDEYDQYLGRLTRM